MRARVCVCACVSVFLKIPSAARGYGPACVSGGSVNIIQTFCVCVIYSSEPLVQRCFQGGGRDFMRARRVRPTGGYTNPVQERSDRARTALTCRRISDRGPSTCLRDERGAIRSWNRNIEPVEQISGNLNNTLCVCVVMFVILTSSPQTCWLLIWHLCCHKLAVWFLILMLSNVFIPRSEASFHLPSDGRSLIISHSNNY